MSERAFGICMGASTITAVELLRNGGAPTVGRVIRRPHEGNPRAIFPSVIDELECGADPILVTGRKFRASVELPSITEPEAVEYALAHVVDGSERYDALVSAGGETFMVYLLDANQRIVGISTGNKCASGTGEFFLQQIRRMDLEVEEAVGLAASGSPYAVSGRCSVFCKSDCTHALNKGEPINDVTAGLCGMISDKIYELLATVPHGRVMITGGVALNSVVMDDLRKRLGSLYIPGEAAYFEALGAGIAAFARGAPRSAVLFNPSHSSFSFLPPLCEAESLVSFNAMSYATPAVGERCLVGLDVGSTTTKAVVMRLSDEAILCSEYLRTNGNPIEASRACFESLNKKLGGTSLEIVGIGVTGSGRRIAGLYALSDGIINEIIAHAAAAVHFDAEVDTIFEIGGQDAKYTYLTNSVASDYAMNEACSAGTGSFLEESAFESLGVKTTEIAPLAMAGRRPPNFNEQCSAFISSDIKNATHEGISRNDILAGLVYSICLNYVNRVKGNRPVGRKIFMQGGVCYNRAVPLALANILKKPVVVPPEPGLMGAYGVALEIKKRLALGLLKEGRFDLSEIVARRVEQAEPFVCAGGKEKCDLKCQINRIRIEGRLYPFGGACNRYYGMRSFDGERGWEELDLIKAMNEVMLEKHVGRSEAGPGAKTIGLSSSFIANRFYPLFHTFFSRLGCRVVRPDGLDQEAINRKTTSMCFPAELALGLFQNLLDKNPDYIFMPHIKELYVPGGIQRRDFCNTCLFVQGEAFWMKQAFPDKQLDGRLLSPTINFYRGWDTQTEVFVELAGSLGFGRAAAERAFAEALAAFERAEAEYKELGRRALAELAADPERIAIVVFGRVYNAYSGLANKGIPQKLASSGMLVIPYEFLPFEEEELDPDYRDYMHWEFGQRILRAAKVVKKNRQLFPVYVTNFLCGPDSLLVSYFRRVMGAKPSLTLELDEHTADAGINTRIEAFLDIVRNFLEVRMNAAEKRRRDFSPARVVAEKGRLSYVDSDGASFPLTHPKVKLIVPNMGDLTTRSFAAICNRSGIRTEGLPVSDSEALRLGRGATTCKECVPMILCLGSLLRYLEQRPSADEKLMFYLPKAAGFCRLGQYSVFTDQVIREMRVRDVALISMAMEENWSELGTAWLIWAWRSIVAGDVFDDIRSAILALALDKATALELFEGEYSKVLEALRSAKPGAFYAQLGLAARALKSIALRTPLHEAPRIVLTGEVFARRDSFTNLDMVGHLAAKGFVVSTNMLSEQLLYTNYLVRTGQSQPNFDALGWLNFHASSWVMQKIEGRIKRILAASGLYEFEKINIEELMSFKNHLATPNLIGEYDRIIGTMHRDALSIYCGVVSVGPFGCMQLRFAEAVAHTQTNVKAKRIAMAAAGRDPVVPGFSDHERIPFLSVESDATPFPQLLQARFENFCLQAARVAERQGKRLAGSVRD